MSHAASALQAVPQPRLHHAQATPTSGNLTISPRSGVSAHAAYTNHLSKVWLMKLMADYTQIANIYTRIQVNALLVYTFN